MGDAAEAVRVLLVERAGSARLLKAMIEQSGFRISHCARSVANGLKFVEQSDVVLLDFDSSSTDPTEVALIRERAPHLPIIVLSGRDDDETALAVVHSGAQDYLAKNQLNPHLLARSMQYAIERARAEQALAQERNFLKKTEVALATERNLLRSLIDNVPDFIFAKDVEGKYILTNIAHAKFLGLNDPSEVRGKTPFDLFPAEQAQKFSENDLAIMRSGQPLLNEEEKSRRADGESRWHLVTKVPLRDDDDRVCGLVGIARDITEQKQAEEKLQRANAELFTALAELKEAHAQVRSVQLQLIEAEKMKSVGRLAAGVAHEVKNPLAIVSMGVQYLAGQTYPNDSNIPLILKDIDEAVKRADTVVRGLLDFSAPRSLELRSEDLNRIIDQSLMLIRGSVPESKLHVRKELAPDLPPLQLDRTKIGQVLLNIFSNALHAMPEGGELTVRTFCEEVVGRQEGDSKRDAIDARRRVVAEIEDTGSGIPEDKLARVYEPFFTTKPTGAGTGLGLTVTKAIIELHRARMEVRNRPEGGVKVRLEFRQ